MWGKIRILLALVCLAQLCEVAWAGVAVTKLKKSAAVDPFPKTCPGTSGALPPTVGTDQPNPASFKYDDLVKLIEKNPTTQKPTQSIEELVPNLPAEFRKNFTFMYKSESPHQATGAVTPTTPRTILFSDDARMTLSFTTNPDKPGFNVLEINEYQDDGSFKLRRIELPGGKPNAKADYGTPPGSTPNDCLRCHGNDPRPIWESYDLWPGAYGAKRDLISDADPKEKSDYEAFLKAKKNTGVFKSLTWPAGTKYPPYYDGAVGNTFTPEVLALMPNARLGMAYTALNRERILRLMKQSPKYEGLKKYFASMLLRCETPPVLADSYRLPSGKTVTEQLNDEQNEKFKKTGLHTEGVLGDADKGYYGLAEIDSKDSIALIEYMAQLLGPEAKREQWSLSGKPGSMTFYDGLTYRGQDLARYEFMYEIFNDLRKSDPNFMSDSKLKDSFTVNPALRCDGYPYGEQLDITRASNKACDYLKANACRPPADCGGGASNCPDGGGYPGNQPSLQNADPSKLAAKITAEGQALLNKCSACHFEPPLAFNKPEQLGAALKKDPTLMGKIRDRLTTKKAADRMPKEAPAFTPQEIEKMMKTLQDLQ